MKLDLSPRGLATPVAAVLKATWGGAKKVVTTHAPAAVAGAWGYLKAFLAFLVSWLWNGTKSIGHPVVVLLVVPLLFAGGYMVGHSMALRGVSLVESEMKAADAKAAAATARAATAEKALEDYKTAHPEAAGVQTPAPTPTKPPAPRPKKKASMSGFGSLLGIGGK